MALNKYGIGLDTVRTAITRGHPGSDEPARREGVGLGAGPDLHLHPDHPCVALLWTLAARRRLPRCWSTPCAPAPRQAQQHGILGLAAILFRAYSLGGGTYTGIEAVSNGLPILREPRAETGKRTMIYMAVSLAFVAGGILLGYLLLNVEAEPGKTLNAVMFERLASNWQVFGFGVGPAIITFALLTEGALLFVAAQTGFVDGPRVLATMAADRWLPRRFANLSARLVTQDGVISIGLASMLILIGTEAKVDLLVVLYAINVFVTFTLSQLGMTTHWWLERKNEKRWLRKLTINGIGTFFTATILMITLTLKFHDGGWVTVVITGGLIARVFRCAAPLRARLESYRAARG